ncbi:MAG: hypothetical protein IJK77_08595 [Lachnospiraceae bacterium]|nr:hypothetical protein [Lachnospiraceae bacterium]
MKAIRLKTEHLFDPLGIDIQKPRLMWNAEGGTKQTAYEIVTEKWRSGRVESSAMHAEYPLPLSSRERVNWKVRLWDENGEPGEWNEAFFEMGLLFAMDWKAGWITGNYSVNKKERYPVDCFRKAFNVGRPVRAARLSSQPAAFMKRSSAAGRSETSAWRPVIPITANASSTRLMM